VFRDLPDLLAAIQAASRDDRLELDPEGEALERLEHALALGRKRVRGIQKELAQAADPEEPRRWGNLLLARLGEVPRGAEAVTLLGFDGKEVRIPLDPASSPQENAGALYREAARRERARERLPELLDAARKEVLALEDLKGKLQGGSLTAREAAPLIPISKRSPPSAGKERRRRPYHRYYSSGGLEIRVGRSSRDNDDLTFRSSDPEDIWLHARGGAGAHVILRWTEKSAPPRKDLAEAAMLAALNSNARTSGTVPVDWTRRKHVRKPRKSPPGSVVPQRVRTLFVEPDPDLPERLRKENPEGDG